MPNGQGWIELGSIGVTTSSDRVNDITAGLYFKELEHDGKAGFSQGSFHNQLLLTNRILEKIISSQMACSFGTGIDLHSNADQATVNDDTSFASDRHPIQSQQDSVLPRSLKAFVVDTSHGQAVESPDGEDGASINKRAVHVSDLEISGDPSIPGGNRASTNFEVFDLP